MPTRWPPWLVGLGAAGAVAFHVRAVAGGCRKDFEVSCEEQPVAFGLVSLMILAVWLFGVAAGFLMRRAAGRFVANRSY